MTTLTDLDALVARLHTAADDRAMTDYGVCNLLTEAAAALAELREENARLAIHRDNLQGSRDYSMDLLLKYLGMNQGPIEYLTRTVIACAERAESRIASHSCAHPLLILIRSARSALSASRSAHAACNSLFD